jgi:hypothetical protein
MGEFVGSCPVSERGAINGNAAPANAPAGAVSFDTVTRPCAGADRPGIQELDDATDAAYRCDHHRDLLAAFGKLDRVGRKAVVNYLQTQVDVDPRDDGERA